MDEQKRPRAWVYARIPGDYDGTMNSYGFATSIDSLNPVNPSPVFAGSTGKTGIDIIQNNIALNHLGKMVDFNFHCGLL